LGVYPDLEATAMQRFVVATLILASAVCPLRADYVYSFLEHYIYNNFDETISSIDWPCTGLTLEGDLIAGKCSQGVTVDDYTDWRWVDLVGEITSPYPPGPWVESSPVSMLQQRTWTTDDFTYWTVVDGVPTAIGYQLGNALVEDVKFDHALTRKRSPQVDPNPPPPEWPEPPTTLTAGTALVLGCIGALRRRRRK
jgi:hypothetical protein